MKANKETPLETSNAQQAKRTLKAKKHLTIPLLSMAHLPLLTCKILGEPYQDEKITALGKDTKIAPTVVLVLDMDTDLEGLLVVNALIASAFERAIPPLTGRYFQFRAGTIREGKNYRDVDVIEMEFDYSDDFKEHSNVGE